MPNVLTLFRLCFGAPVIIVLYANHYQSVAIVFLAFVLTDALDGWLARLMKSESEWGTLLDPIADQALVLTILCYLVWTGELYFLGIMLLAAREAVVVLSRIFGLDMPTRLLGRIKVTFEYVAILCILLGGEFKLLGYFSLLLALVFSYVSLAQYLFLAFWNRGGYANYRA